MATNTKPRPRRKKPRAPQSEIPDSDILALMHAGEIEILDSFTCPRVFHRGRELKPELNQQGGRGQINGGQRFRYHIRRDGKRRKIMASRIVWLYWFGAIEAGYNVHHGSGGRMDDSLGNLCKLSEDEHRRLHFGSGDEYDDSNF